jgi:hypothetical protein
MSKTAIRTACAIVALGVFQLCHSPATCAAAKVHALLCFDTDAGGGIADGMKADREILLRVLWKSFDTDERRNRIEWTVLEGGDLTPDRIYKRKLQNPFAN